MKTIKEMLDMELNTWKALSAYTDILRVPGGWIYKNEGAMCFVPEPQEIEISMVPEEPEFKHDDLQVERDYGMNWRIRLRDELEAYYPEGTVDDEVYAEIELKMDDADYDTAFAMYDMTLNEVMESIESDLSATTKLKLGLL